MTQTIIFIENSNDIELLQSHKIQLTDSKIFSFNIAAHTELEKNKIAHEIAERFLSRSERINIFENCVSFWHWYEKIPYKNDFEINGINLLGMLDVNELHQLFLDRLLIFYTAKKIIEEENPITIITNKQFSEIINVLAKEKKIKIHTSNTQSEYTLPFDKFKIQFKVGFLKISFSLKRSSYLHLKRLFEQFIGSLLNLWFNNNLKKTTLFLEFNPSSYSELLNYLHKFDENPVFFNRRRSAVWNLASIKILKKFNGKLINEEKLLTNEKETIVNHVAIFLNKLEKLNSNTDLEKLFYIGNDNIWTIIKDPLFTVYKKRLEEFIILAILTKKILQMKPKCIISLYTTGETEKAILDMNKNTISSVLLEHGYANYVKETSTYDVTSMYTTFKDKIAVWGNTQKQYLLNNRNISENRIAVTGSPRHDSFFKNKQNKFENSTKKTILILPPVIDTISGLNTTDSYLQFEVMIKKIINKLKNFSDIQIAIKLHPAQDASNDWMRSLFEKIDPSIKVFQITPIIKHLQECDAIIHIDISGLGPSTALLEALILEKPVMNVVLQEEIFPFDCIKDNAVLSFSLNSDIEKGLEDLLFNEDVRNSLKKNAHKHVENYLINHGTASESLANFLHMLNYSNS